MFVYLCLCLSLECILQWCWQLLLQRDFKLSVMRLLLNHNEHVTAFLPKTLKEFDCRLFTDDQTLAPLQHHQTFLPLLLLLLLSVKQNRRK